TTLNVSKNPDWLEPFMTPVQSLKEAFSFASGGMTSGGKGQVAGVVHGGEWVMPTWMMKKYPQLAGMLEGMRKRGYQSGGFVGNIGQSG
ncbi:hypothetical protein ACMYLL_23230, partial [Salmonella enterica subsp. enterica serovar Enteritidis]|uniref:hypothetical protein n=1 Tax=Salmonella enterica TaxID=28901 RepID=UPI0039E7544A